MSTFVTRIRALFGSRGNGKTPHTDIRSAELRAYEEHHRTLLVGRGIITAWRMSCFPTNCTRWWSDATMRIFASSRTARSRPDIEPCRGCHLGRDEYRLGRVGRLAVCRHCLAPHFEQRSTFSTSVIRESRGTRQSFASVTGSTSRRWLQLAQMSTISN